jgi:hypothetical protein
VWRGIVFLLAGLAWGQTLDDAIRTITARTASHLAANEVARITMRNTSSLGAADAARIQSGVDRGLRRRVRNPSTIDVTITISENVRGLLLISQVHDSVEMMEFRIDAAKPTFGESIGKTMIWQQETPILDVATLDEQMVVLDSKEVARFEHRQRVEVVAIPQPMPRDPRGRIEVDGDALIVHLPGSTCKGTWKPLSFSCAAGGEFAGGRNTLDSDVTPAHYEDVRAGGNSFMAAVDGRVYVSDKTAFDGWGSDFVAVCRGTRLLASGPGDRDTRDFIALYDSATHPPARLSELLEFPGPVTALSATLAVARNLSTGRYEAYSLSVDCGR